MCQQTDDFSVFFCERCQDAVPDAVLRLLVRESLQAEVQVEVETKFENLPLLLSQHPQSPRTTILLKIQ